MQLATQKAPAVPQKDKVGVRSIINDSATEKGQEVTLEEEGKLTHCEGNEKEADRIIHGKTEAVMFHTWWNIFSQTHPTNRGET